MREGVQEGLRKCQVMDTRFRDLEASLGARIDRCFDTMREELGFMEEGIEFKLRELATLPKLAKDIRNLALRLHEVQ